MKAGGKLSTLRGVIIPVDWDESDNAISVAISGNDEKEYHVSKDEMGKQLLALIQQEVEVSGVVRQWYLKSKFTHRYYISRVTNQEVKDVLGFLEKETGNRSPVKYRETAQAAGYPAGGRQRSDC